MDFLARREHSFYELIQKLTKKFPETDSGLLKEVIETLRAENLQSDDRFAESYVRYRKSKGFGYRHIRADLSSRKVSGSIIHLYLLEDDDWGSMVGELIEKKLAGKRKIEYGGKDHRRLMTFLSGRGFTGEQIRKGLEIYLV